MSSSSYYVGLVHYPVFNKHQEIVTTSITNMDVHDISRTCRTYGVNNFLLINPLSSQKELYKKIIGFWQSATGKNYQPDRSEALDNTVFLETIQEAVDYVKKQENANPILVTTTAKQRENQISYDAFNNLNNDDSIRNDSEAVCPALLLFGTGYGLADEVHDKADYVLSPIEPQSGYNHLSVRSAVAIVLDRLIPKNKGGINGHTTSSKPRSD